MRPCHIARPLGSISFGDGGAIIIHDGGVDATAADYGESAAVMPLRCSGAIEFRPPGRGRIRNT